MTSARCRTAVVLAAGVGRRMRVDDGTALTGEQRRLADAGLKMLMPIAGRPLLDRSIDALREAGIERVCLVTSSGAALDGVAADRSDVAVATAVQRAPRGTADALASAAEVVDREPFLMVNADTYYPPAELARLVALDGCGVLAVDRRRATGSPGGLDIDRLAQFALLELAPGGTVSRLIEKPGVRRLAALPDPVLLSVNGWRFDRRIFRHCGEVTPSARGELELPSAVNAAIAAGIDFEPVVAREPVLDLTARADVALFEAAFKAPR